MTATFHRNTGLRSTKRRGTGSLDLWSLEEVRVLLPPRHLPVSCHNSKIHSRSVYGLRLTLFVSTQACNLTDDASITERSGGQSVASEPTTEREEVSHDRHLISYGTQKRECRDVSFQGQVRRRDPQPVQPPLSGLSLPGLYL